MQLPSVELGRFDHRDSLEKLNVLKSTYLGFLRHLRIQKTHPKPSARNPKLGPKPPKPCLVDLTKAKPKLLRLRRAAARRPAPG